jgi:hypothetical protein
VFREIYERVKYRDAYRFAERKGLPLSDFRTLNRMYGEEFWKKMRDRATEEHISKLGDDDLLRLFTYAKERRDVENREEILATIMAEMKKRMQK